MAKDKLAELRLKSRLIHQLPTLSQCEIARRWRVDPDTARGIIRDAKIPRARGPWKRARYCILDIWRLEGIPISTALSRSDHSELMSPLLKVSDLAEVCRCSSATIRNWVRAGMITSITLGGSIRFHDHVISSLFEGNEVPKTEFITRRQI